MSDTATRTLVQQLFAKVGQGARPEDIALLFSEEVDWFIAGDMAQVPWIGRKTGRAGVASFYQAIRDRLVSEHFELTDILADGPRAVALGRLASRVKSTGKLIETAFAFDVTVAGGLIARFHMLEDSFAVAQAMRAD
ncbi:nuclear transport factor 2 family protein [Variovorax boronicumulans]|uniref:nuclear transport factor 2 family protein n=1 Tax=Variovorax boronicumulans TaxID=436515 RepID=UPI001C57C107